MIGIVGGKGLPKIERRLFQETPSSYGLFIEQAMMPVPALTSGQVRDGD